MRTVMLAGLLFTLGCGGRSIVVQNPAPAEAVSITVSNSLSQPVNVYVTGRDAEVFVGRIAANSSESVAIRNIAQGTTIRLRAVTQDGSRTYMREGIELREGYEWRVP